MLQSSTVLCMLQCEGLGCYSTVQYYACCSVRGWMLQYSTVLCMLQCEGLDVTVQYSTMHAAV